MPHHDVVVIGASAGGIQALRELARNLPADLPAAVFVVVHIAPTAPSALAAILARAGALPASTAVDGAAIEHGTIVVAPPDFHLRFRDGRVRLDRHARERGHRPAIDPLFRSAAHCFGPRVVGVVLSGTLDDGAAGAVDIAARGGIVIAQDPVEASHPGMPESTIARAHPEYVLPVAKIATLLATLATSDLPSHRSLRDKTLDPA